uniref:Endonuclease/exonuclease/phosphatase domain-containing protein n=1 Tax=Chromera velia CCMP2878 TaxID=1169474 RepID=A0A0G4FB75_9ALVE|eukprot:Cvel_16130.t1-p1 / transcript=Cvel_16130.t1 / gene=Cvel_16130 / organism=Chromera_velia_CCMP2878 / gene_product=hypothetical protein / transcript_product=hypothetical protein / location=Cvel_scaffold1227:34523-39867(+) / protein_length=771 / sequence_SO=supercontig / SO=protein_coding / is_pseudo=false
MSPGRKSFTFGAASSLLLLLVLLQVTLSLTSSLQLKESLSFTLHGNTEDSPPPDADGGDGAEQTLEVPQADQEEEDGKEVNPKAHSLFQVATFNTDESFVVKEQLDAMLPRFTKKEEVGAYLFFFQEAPSYLETDPVYVPQGRGEQQEVYAGMLKYLQESDKTAFSVKEAAEAKPRRIATANLEGNLSKYFKSTGNKQYAMAVVNPESDIQVWSGSHELRSRSERLWGLGTNTDKGAVTLAVRSKSQKIAALFMGVHLSRVHGAKKSAAQVEKAEDLNDGFQQALDTHCQKLLIKSDFIDQKTSLGKSPTDLSTVVALLKKCFPSGIYIVGDLNFRLDQCSMADLIGSEQEDRVEFAKQLNATEISPHTIKWSFWKAYFKINSQKRKEIMAEADMGRRHVLEQQFGFTLDSPYDKIPSYKWNPKHLPHVCKKLRDSWTTGDLTDSDARARGLNVADETCLKTKGKGRAKDTWACAMTAAEGDRDSCESCMEKTKGGEFINIGYTERLFYWPGSKRVASGSLKWTKFVPLAMSDHLPALYIVRFKPPTEPALPPEEEKEVGDFQGMENEKISQGGGPLSLKVPGDDSKESTSTQDGPPKSVSPSAKEQSDSLPALPIPTGDVDEVPSPPLHAGALGSAPEESDAKLPGPPVQGSGSVVLSVAEPDEGAPLHSGALGSPPSQGSGQVVLGGEGRGPFQSPLHAGALGSPPTSAEDTSAGPPVSTILHSGSLGSPSGSLNSSPTRPRRGAIRMEEMGVPILPLEETDEDDNEEP